jgi:hypothetical protein
VAKFYKKDSHWYGGRNSKYSIVGDKLVHGNQFDEMSKKPPTHTPYGHIAVETIEPAETIVNFDFDQKNMDNLKANTHDPRYPHAQQTLDTGISQHYMWDKNQKATADMVATRNPEPTKKLRAALDHNAPAETRKDIPVPTELFTSKPRKVQFENAFVHPTLRGSLPTLIGIAMNDHPDAEFHSPSSMTQYSSRLARRGIEKGAIKGAVSNESGRQTLNRNDDTKWSMAHRPEHLDFSDHDRLSNQTIAEGRQTAYKLAGLNKREKRPAMQGEQMKLPGIE